LEKPQSVTSVEVSPDQERKSRMVRYSLAMGIRMVCIILAMVVQGWFMWVLFAGAIFLPYFAVVIANAQGAPTTKKAPQAQAATIAISASDFLKASKED